MTKGLRRSISRGKAGQRDTIALRYPVNHTIVVDGATGVGFGSVVVGALPEGHLLLLGARADLTFTEADAGIANDFAGDYGVGSTPAGDATITGTDVDIIASTALAATSSVATAAANNVATAVIDNSAGTGEVNLNMLVDDADISADGVDVAVTGYVTLAIVVIGDD